MNSAFTAILTPQLMENGTEFEITEDQESWIVSIDYLIIPFMSILSGILQTKFGPALVSILALCRQTSLKLMFIADVTSCMCTVHHWLDIGVSCYKYLVYLCLQTIGGIKSCIYINIHLCSGDLYQGQYESYEQFSSRCC